MNHSQPQNNGKDILYNQNALPVDQKETHTSQHEDHIDERPCLTLECPQNIDISDEKMHEFQTLAQEMNISGEQAQRLLDYAAAQTQHLQETTQKTQQKEIENLIKKAESDEEFGGTRMQESLITAQNALQALASDELIELLEDKGLGNHPEIIRLFYRIGQHVSEDKFISTNSGGSQNEKSAADILYGTR